MNRAGEGGIKMGEKERGRKGEKEGEEGDQDGGGGKGRETGRRMRERRGSGQADEVILVGKCR